MKRHALFVPYMEAVKCRLHRRSREQVATGAERTLHYFFMYIGM
jgi:hypothetical protein